MKVLKENSWCRLSKPSENGLATLHTTEPRVDNVCLSVALAAKPLNQF